MTGLAGQDVEASGIGLGRTFPGLVELPPVCGKGKEEKEERVRVFADMAREKERDPDTIWTDGSKLDSGGVGAGVAWYEEVDMVSKEQGESMVVSRRGFSAVGKRRDQGGPTRVPLGP